MAKLSKSDLPIDRRSVEEKMAEFFKHRSIHFTVGTGIKIAHQPPATILSVEDGVLTCQREDGSVFIVRPIALNRS